MSWTSLTPKWNCALSDEEALTGWFAGQRQVFEDAYLQTDDPYKQSGWGSTPERWRFGREVILDGVPRNGDFLDIGCANGLLLACLIEWAGERGVTLTPHGIDFVPELVKLAKARFPENAANFEVANAFDWQPSQQYTYVHTLLEYVPKKQQPAYLQRVLDEVVAPGGRLIVSSYGSRGKNEKPLDIDFHLQMLGFRTTGCGNSLEPDGWVATRVAWVDR